MGHQAIAAEALSHYEIQSPIITFIRHNENLTYKITDESGSAYLLRVHKPVHAELHGLQHSKAGLNGEMELLQALGENTALNVQKPVRNREGEFVTRIGDGDGFVHCTMLHWLEGRDSQPDDFASREDALRYGRQVGMLHRFTSGYTPEPAASRPTYAGIGENEAMLERLTYGREHGIFAPGDFSLMREAFQLINERLRRYEPEPGTWGIIHADINRANVIVTDRGFTLIDYCLYGHGYFMYDAAGGALSVPSERRTDFMEGYEEEFPSIRGDSMKLLEGFMLLNIFGYYSFHMMNTAVHPWMRERLPSFCANMVAPFVEERPIFDLL
ncbi:phosphotransferase enzyme family protein [Paenibacillus dendritiformis]|uniref:phosphotransferase enzyme family protein n=1 Tax=Paenibacillus dendritiformis TaxID=130049 RepID=UPI00387E0279